MQRRAAAVIYIIRSRVTRDARSESRPSNPCLPRARYTLHADLSNLRSSSGLVFSIALWFWLVLDARIQFLLLSVAVIVFIPASPSSWSILNPGRSLVMRFPLVFVANALAMILINLNIRLVKNSGLTFTCAYISMRCFMCQEFGPPSPRRLQITSG